MVMRRMLPPGVNPVRHPVDPRNWGIAFQQWVEDQQRQGERAHDPENEIRWGAKSNVVVDIPALSTVDVQTPLVQIVDIRAPARGWLLTLGVNWENKAAGLPGETIAAEFSYEMGVGSTRFTRVTRVLLAQTAPFPFDSVTTEPFPAGTIFVSCSLSFGPSSGAARQYNISLTALASPVVR